MKADLHGGSEFKIKCVMMIIFCIVMANHGSSTTDAFYRIFLWFYNLKHKAEAVNSSTMMIEYLDYSVTGF